MKRSPLQVTTYSKIIQLLKHNYWHLWYVAECIQECLCVCVYMYICSIIQDLTHQQFSPLSCLVNCNNTPIWSLSINTILYSFLSLLSFNRLPCCYCRVPCPQSWVIHSFVPCVYLSCSVSKTVFSSFLVWKVVVADRVGAGVGRIAWFSSTSRGLVQG